ncbi:MAG TPA: winged helix-turn-helix domain-containing protein [Blastocatellia bacterium]|nr:winged helix-turn-helix domain-containing protein [Blastocatellia bacterium]
MSLLINHFYRFGEFTLDTDQRVLLRGGKPLPLAPKVFDTLLMLVENGGRVVTKDELMNRVWPDAFVEEANLTYSIQQLRKTLVDDARSPRYVETMPRRGYRFIAEVEEVLMEREAVNEQISQRFETSDTRSPGGAGAANLPAEAQKPEPVIASVNGGQSAISENRLDARPAAGAASAGLSKRYIALTAAMVIALAGVGLVLWKFSNGSDKSTGENKPPASSLKLEKLTGTGRNRYVAISPDGKYIAYTQVIERKQSIWLRQLSTNTNVEIVPPTGPERIYGLQFANSGEYVYFARGDPIALYRVSSVGGVPIKIADNLEDNFSVSADDSQIAFIRVVIRPDGQRESFLIIASSDGTGERTLLATAHPYSLNAPVWSPDGESIICAYFSRDGGRHGASLVEVRVADGLKQELPSGSFFHISKMAWLPDKSGLIMAARKKHEGDNQLWRVSYPGIEVSQITEGVTNFVDLSVAPGLDKAAAAQATRISHIWVGSSREPENLEKILQGTESFCWTPNGQIVYSSKAGGNVDIWVMQPDGTGQKQLTVNPAIDGTPTVTPDSRYIVFVSNRTGAYEIWRMSLDGSDQTQLTRGGGIRPAISPEGKWVLYNTQNWHLWKVSIDGGDPIRLAEHVGHFPSVSPDGKMIACLARDEPNRKLSLLVLPYEGGQPLKRIEFAGGGFRGFRLQWSADGKALIYGVERNGMTALIKQPLNGSPPEEIMSFDEDELFDFGYSYDGQSLAVTRGGWQHDVVLIRDFNRY